MFFRVMYKKGSLRGTGTSLQKYHASFWDNSCRFVSREKAVAIGDMENAPSVRNKLLLTHTRCIVACRYSLERATCGNV